MRKVYCSIIFYIEKMDRNVLFTTEIWFGSVTNFLTWFMFDSNMTQLFAWDLSLEDMSFIKNSKPKDVIKSKIFILHEFKWQLWLYPNGDNWVCTRVIEDIIGAELHR